MDLSPDVVRKEIHPVASVSLSFILSAYSVLQLSGYCGAVIKGTVQGLFLFLFCFFLEWKKSRFTLKTLKTVTIIVTFFFFFFFGNLQIPLQKI